MSTPHTQKQTAAPAAEQARAVLEQVRLLARQHPLLSHHLAGAVAGLAWEVSRTPRRDRDSVLLALERYPGLTFAELRHDTRLRPERLAEILLEFVGRGLVECRATRRRAGTHVDPHLRSLLSQLARERGRRADLRGEHLFALTHTPAACSLSLAPRGRSPLADLAEQA